MAHVDRSVEMAPWSCCHRPIVRIKRSLAMGRTDVAAGPRVIESYPSRWPRRGSELPDHVERCIRRPVIDECEIRMR